MPISPVETVARILCSEWVDGGTITLDAFALAPKETYLSVNRPAVPTFANDVRQFVTSHQSFIITKGNELAYSAAMMSVSRIREISVEIDETKINLDVDVEARAAHTKSHAGIFVRTNGENIVKGRTIMSASVPKGVSSDDILMEVQWLLRDMSVLQVCQLSEQDEKE